MTTTTNKTRVAVIGAGAWGTALAIVLGRKGAHGFRHEVRLWANELEVSESIEISRINERFLPEFCFAGIDYRHQQSGYRSRRRRYRGQRHAFAALPRAVRAHATSLRPETLFVSCTKGLENGTLLRMTEVIADVLRSRQFTPRLAALSGPSFAREVARGDPTAVTVAALDGEVTRAVQQAFNDSRFRVYTNDDLIGVELGGALKNIIAIAAGVCDGLGLGHNSVAALITPVAELARLVVACGGRLETMAGLAGLGDLVLTCTGDLSPTAASESNRQGPQALGTSSPALMAPSPRSLHYESCRRLRIKKSRDAHHQQMYAILENGKTPQQAIEDLMNRAARRKSTSPESAENTWWPSSPLALPARLLYSMMPEGLRWGWAYNPKLHTETYLRRMRIGVPSADSNAVPSDLALATAVRSGDQGAMATLIRPYSSIVYAVALRCSRIPAQPRTCREDIFMQLWRNPEPSTPAAAIWPHGWRRSPAHRSIDALRRRGPRTTSKTSRFPSSPTSPAMPICSRALDNSVGRCKPCPRRKGPRWKWPLRGFEYPIRDRRKNWRAFGHH